MVFRRECIRDGDESVTNVREIEVEDIIYGSDTPNYLNRPWDSRPWMSVSSQ